MRSLILGITLGFVFFTFAMLVTDVPARASTISKGYITGDISEICVHARLSANDKLAEGLPSHYGPELINSCGAL